MQLLQVGPNSDPEIPVDPAMNEALSISNSALAPLAALERWITFTQQEVMDVRQDLTAFRQESHQVRIISQQQIDVLTRQLRDVKQEIIDLHQSQQDFCFVLRSLQQAIPAREKLIEAVQSSQTERANNIEELFHKVFLLFQRFMQNADIPLATTQEIAESPSRQNFDVE